MTISRVPQSYELWLTEILSPNETEYGCYAVGMTGRVIYWLTCHDPENGSEVATPMVVFEISRTVGGERMSNGAVEVTDGFCLGNTGPQSRFQANEYVTAANAGLVKSETAKMRGVEK